MPSPRLRARSGEIPACVFYSRKMGIPSSQTELKRKTTASLLDPLSCSPPRPRTTRGCGGIPPCTPALLFLPDADRHTRKTEQPPSRRAGCRAAAGPDGAAVCRRARAGALHVLRGGDHRRAGRRKRAAAAGPSDDGRRRDGPAGGVVCAAEGRATRLAAVPRGAGGRVGRTGRGRAGGRVPRGAAHPAGRMRAVRARGPPDAALHRDARDEERLAPAPRHAGRREPAHAPGAASVRADRPRALVRRPAGGAARRSSPTAVAVGGSTTTTTTNTNTNTNTTTNTNTAAANIVAAATAASTSPVVVRLGHRRRLARSAGHRCRTHAPPPPGWLNEACGNAACVRRLKETTQKDNATQRWCSLRSRSLGTRCTTRRPGFSCDPWFVCACA